MSRRFDTSGAIDPAVRKLQDYLRIPTVHPDVNYDECIKFLKTQAEEIGLPVQVVDPLPKKPALVMTWVGEQPELPSILLNSHMDVAPVVKESWKHPPFDAVIENNIIYGRGVQDMKSVGMQYLEAVRRLKANGTKLKRTVHISFVSDEEIQAQTSIAKFVETDLFKSLNVGFALDKGLASATQDYLVYNGLRTIWHLTVICTGQSGHGSLLLPNNSGEKLRYMINKFMDLRAESVRLLAENPQLNIGDVTSVNLTMISGGIQNNIIPERISVSFDVRVARNVELEEFENTIQTWCLEAGPGVTCEWAPKDPYLAPAPLDDYNIFWAAFKQASNELGMILNVHTFNGGTDGSILREAGIQALGFSPMNNTVPGLHENDESLNLDVFINGIQIYKNIISAVANA